MSVPPPSAISHMPRRFTAPPLDSLDSTRKRLPDGLKCLSETTSAGLRGRTELNPEQRRRPAVMASRPPDETVESRSPVRAFLILRTHDRLDQAGKEHLTCGVHERVAVARRLHRLAARTLDDRTRRKIPRRSALIWLSRSFGYVAAWTPSDVLNSTCSV
jgi:hypothetical protein